MLEFAYVDKSKVMTVHISVTLFAFHSVESVLDMMEL